MTPGRSTILRGVRRLGAAVLLLAVAGAARRGAPDDPPTDWIDPATGHRVIRLSTEPGSQTLYFHDNAYTPDGDKYVFSSPSGIMLLDLTTLGTSPPKPELIVPGAGGAYAARRTREVYFVRRVPGAARGAAGQVFAYNVDTKAIRPVPNATRTLINADETFTVTPIAAEDPTGKTPRPAVREARPQLQRMFPGKTMAELTPEQQYAVTKEEGLARRALNPEPMAFVFTNLRTAKADTVGYQYGWLNHMQFNPKDPNLLLYCHEGTWHEVDRIWTIRTDGTGQRLMHKRTMDMEIAGHEFWGHDGKTIWYGLQTPRSKEFWLAGVNVESGERVRYKIGRDQWSVHYNVSRDGKLFAGDGGDPGQVAFAKDGQWIYAFRPRADGEMEWERLVDMSKHNYRLEPNVTIMPDGKWVVFRSNMHGVTHVYAAEVAKAK